MKILKSVLAVLVVCALSIAAYSTENTEGAFNLADTWVLSWGTKTVGIYGSAASNYFRIKTNATDAISVDSAQAVTLSGALTVDGATTLTGAVTLPDSTVTTAKIAAQAVTTEKLYLDLPTAYLPCVTTAKRLGYCTTVGALGVCDNCN